MCTFKVLVHNNKNYLLDLRDFFFLPYRIHFKMKNGN